MAGNRAALIKGFGGRDDLWGSAYDDTLDGGGGRDFISGDAGRDFIIGDLGNDELWGGAGDDTFVFRSVSESSLARPDYIGDFRRGDRIDLSGIDADERLAGDQAFVLAGRPAANGAWFSNGFLFADVNGDGRADFALELSGVRGLTTVDVML